MKGKYGDGMLSNPQFIKEIVSLEDIGGLSQELEKGYVFFAV